MLDLPLGDADRIAKLIPNMSKLGKIFGQPEAELRKKFRSDEWEKVNQLLGISEGDDLEAQTVKLACVLEGSLRNTGIHACGVIITPDDIKTMSPAVLEHRLILRPEFEIEGLSVKEVIGEILKGIAVPR